jgi:hypothetical protein
VQRLLPWKEGVVRARPSAPFAVPRPCPRGGQLFATQATIAQADSCGSPSQTFPETAQGTLPVSRGGCAAHSPANHSVLPSTCWPRPDGRPWPQTVGRDA